MSQAFSEKVKNLGLPLGNVIVIGSGVLDQLGIRTASDIDLVLTSATYDTLKQQASEWVEAVSVSGAKYLENNLAGAEAWLTLPTKQGEMDFEQLTEFTDVIDGVRFVSLDFIRDWKLWMRRDKDKKDIELIDKFLSGQHDA